MLFQSHLRIIIGKLAWLLCYITASFTMTPIARQMLQTELFGQISQNTPQRTNRVATTGFTWNTCFHLEHHAALAV